MHHLLKRYDQVRDHRPGPLAVERVVLKFNHYCNDEFEPYTKTLNDRLDVMKFIVIHDDVANVQQVEVGSIVQLRRFRFSR